MQFIIPFEILFYEVPVLNLRQVVTPDMVSDTRWLRSPKVGDLMSSALKQMSASASLSMQNVMVESSTRWWVASTALYGSTIPFETWAFNSHQQVDHLINISDLHHLDLHHNIYRLLHHNYLGARHDWVGRNKTIRKLFSQSRLLARWIIWTWSHLHKSFHQHKDNHALS